MLNKNQIKHFVSIYEAQRRKEVIIRKINLIAPFCDYLNELAELEEELQKINNVLLTKN